MKSVLTGILLAGVILQGISQEVIQLPYEKATSTTWEGGEKEYYSQIWQNPVVTNVSVPTIQVFKP
ncbi:MAG: alpha/beta hydrolase, partial [Eudoraea sp.]|nr:alpha/beta hydrolase [Eudoraea sp.]